LQATIASRECGTIATPFGRGAVAVNAACLQPVPVYPCELCCCTIRYENLAIICHHTCRFRETGQCREVMMGSVVNNFEAILPCMCHEHATRFRIKSAMIKEHISSTGDQNFCKPF
jgi:hypothetical protein